ncbi:30S ribosomal protein S12 methylthiotransferase RimO [Pseudonocardia sp. KRD-184]|uniref:Ribosomal protein uS12 methylthiotransferase RimO n=1 Tax=Pseudonocardia oceani TaxID=2792013 RepID=A0ABS6U4L4_9PSEU|nr:30S ribosomal protein S12 methylthiotransferase RimO [Pseudonocardia oceani]MBW0096700.1 30S ribosomal protein S12 methylthiotransferase RimO [Pseudonocardia oceani]MBW0111862.1 30S ribosomal protein S12 methylthiotransferase RimO [Pseudonocardia oceani]MBW0123975.1 30S ribosomal protein S12 methylthiotransferase RimO [Pseudonocardia oceani]MBW0127180.1 30S ribosomal protein S12 methylthiotransferase RimO [Pseudonocardia oceani]
MLTLGCARNEVDSEEIAGRLTDSGWELVDADDGADVILVNTCGFVEQAKKDSIDTLLAASDSAQESGAKVVAVGCLAERYGKELADQLPEADAVLGFDAYPDLAERLGDVLGGHAPAAHVPVDRRTLLPISPVERPAASADVAVPGHAWIPNLARTRLTEGPVANLKLASGCDRRCTFCAIPSFRGSFVSRPADDVVAEAAWLGMDGVRELYLVSENSTSYGKDLPGGTRALVRLLPRLTQVPGIDRVRVSYLQPAEMRPDLIEVIASTPGVAPYFDLSFQHAAPTLLRRMRRFGSRADFLDLCARIRALAPEAGIRSNFIVGFPGETDEEFAELEAFLSEARLDAVGLFGYSDEDGTEALSLPDKVPAEVITERLARLSSLVEELMSQRAEERIGTEVEVLVEVAEDEDFECTGRAAHQAPDVDGECVFERGSGLAVGDLVKAVVVGTEGADLVVSAREQVPRSTLARATAGVSGSGG